MFRFQSLVEGYILWFSLLEIGDQSQHMKSRAGGGRMEVLCALQWPQAMMHEDPNLAFALGVAGPHHRETASSRGSP